MVKAGLYRDRIEIQRLSESAADDYGNVYTGWSTLAYRSGDFREKTGKEKITSGALLDRSTATLRMRSDSVTSTITNADRIICRSKTWAVLSVIQVDSKDRVLEFVCEEGRAS